MFELPGAVVSTMSFIGFAPAQGLKSLAPGSCHWPFPRRFPALLQRWAGLRENFIGGGLLLYNRLECGGMVFPLFYH
jgi:hypothetical protein